ncbi:hypothetical protein I3842_04G183600 [Carya illinoinensis]|uniref:Uncharacterized protein n=1 Tax=Carya illinoinensis TaxID=32201 RepID=A0A922FDZ2_CARIL|nr:hypothetical protein I3842_04G183600 [Carya illinoinensis]
MVFSQRKSVFVLVVVIVCLILFAPAQLGAMRPLDGEEYWRKEASGLLIRSVLQKGTGTPSGPNPCTHIPRRSPGVCT